MAVELRDRPAAPARPLRSGAPTQRRARPLVSRKAARRRRVVGVVFNRRLLVAVAALGLFGSSVAAWAVRYDSHQSRLLLPGTVVGGVPVQGMTSQQATDAVRASVETPLRKPITIHSDGAAPTPVTPWDLGWRVNVPAAVHEAAGLPHQGNLPHRIWRRLFGKHERVIDVKPKWTNGLLQSVVDQAGKAAFIPPKDAKLDTSDGWVKVVPDQPGRSLDADKAKKLLTDAAQRGDPQVTLPTAVTFAKVRAPAFAKVILVRTGENKLYLYQDGQIVKSYSVATGQSRYPTPMGVFKIVSKQVNPVWINPHSSWSSNMPERIGPGPTNPLGQKALALSASGVLIHATPDVASIGSSASHGCIRMAPGDEEDLFPQVATGTPVAIVRAGEAKPRTTPAGNPNDAATQF